MIEIPTDFAYLGSRDYVHGTTLLSAFVDALEAHASGPLVVKRMKFVREAHANGRLALSTGTFDPALSERASCTFLASAGAATWRGLFTENDTAVGRREPVSYAIAALAAEGFGGRCEISAENRNQLLQVLVEANKRFHEAACAAEGPVAVRFGYLESWTVPPADARFSGELRAVNLIAHKTSDGHTTINRLSYGDTTLTLCFHVTARAEARR